jgi:hypothetical protein
VPNGTLEIRQRKGFDANARAQMSTDVRAQIEARLGAELRQRLEDQDSTIKALQVRIDSMASASPQRRR